MEHQEFNGITFYRTDKNDYFRYSSNGKTILMHRYVWEFYNCKIPKGYHIHHIDGDKANNDISNLKLMKGVEHWKLHGRMLTDEERDWKRSNVVQNAVPKATEWHKSEEGKQWHKEQVQSRKDNRTERHCVCEQCGKGFTIFSNKDSKFCSNACKSKYRRDNHLDDEVRICVVCGKEFSTNKFKKTVYCSRSCRMKLEHINNPDVWKRGKKA